MATNFKVTHRQILLILACLAHGITSTDDLAQLNAQQPDPPGQVAGGEHAVIEAYLFAHMTSDDYGELYYSVSLDGLHWESINASKCVYANYHGHPDIALGHDDRFYLVGNESDAAPDINFWVSDDLIHWESYGAWTPDLSRVPNYPKPLARIGAPKLFFDKPSAQYVLTWHTPHQMDRDDLPEPYWASQRTLYATSPDLRTFSPPARLFDWDMATIDVVLRREGDKYFAVIKDERYATSDWITGKTIRIAHADALLGPYSKPGPPISPSFREAPTVVPSPDGRWRYLYYEQYPGVGYGLSVSDSLAGKWFQVSGNTNHRDWDKYRLPAKIRHGSMLPITRKQYDALRAAFP